MKEIDMKKLEIAARVLLIVFLLGIAVPIAFSFFLTRFMTPEQVGQYSLAHLYVAWVWTLLKSAVSILIGIWLFL